MDYSFFSKYSPTGNMPHGPMRFIRKLHMDFGGVASMVTPWANKRCVEYSPRSGEPWKVQALPHIYGSNNSHSLSSRVAEIGNADNKIGELLDIVEANVR